MVVDGVEWLVNLQGFEGLLDLEYCRKVGRNVVFLAWRLRMKITGEDYG